MSALLAWMNGIPAPLLYLVLGLGAAVENVVPAVPADTFVALGGLLSEVGTLNAGAVFFATWILNVTSALVVYRLAYRHGRSWLDTPTGRRLLRPHQMERMARFYARWGTLAIFFTRFLPGVRSVVPIFAGVSLQGWLPVAVPIAVASAIWYGGLVWIGAWAGSNLDRLSRVLADVNDVLLSVAVVVAIFVGAWWWRSRREPEAR